MWPIMKGKDLEILRKSEDGLFEIKSVLGLTLLLLFVTDFFTLLMMMLHGVSQAAVALVTMEVIVTSWIAISLIVANKWYGELEGEGVQVAEDSREPLVDRSRRVIDRVRGRSGPAPIAHHLAPAGG